MDTQFENSIVGSTERFISPPESRAHDIYFKYDPKTSLKDHKWKNLCISKLFFSLI